MISELVIGSTLPATHANTTRLTPPSLRKSFTCSSFDPTSSAFSIVIGLSWRTSAARSMRYLCLWSRVTRFFSSNASALLSVLVAAFLRSGLLPLDRFIDEAISSTDQSEHKGKWSSMRLEFNRNCHAILSIK